MSNSFVEVWREPDDFWRMRNANYILPEDWGYFHERGFLDTRSDFQTRYDFKSFVQSERFNKGRDDKGFHFSLLPIPYVGNLEKADIFLLMLNPGFHVGDYYAEYESPGFRDVAINNLLQQFNDDGSWLWCLDPQYCWHPGYSYWIGKLGELAMEYGRRAFNGDFRRALFEVSRRVAIVELVPYHSRNFVEDPRFSVNLPSAQYAKEWANSELVSKIANDEAVAVVMRKSRVWGLTEQKGVVCYDQTEARSAHLSVKSRGGALILNRLLTARQAPLPL